MTIKDCTSVNGGLGLAAERVISTEASPLLLLLFFCFPSLHIQALFEGVNFSRPELYFPGPQCLPSQDCTRSVRFLD